VQKEDMNTHKLVINWQNFAQVWLQLKFTFIIRPKHFHKRRVTALWQLIYNSLRNMRFCTVNFLKRKFLKRKLLCKCETQICNPEKLNFKAQRKLCYCAQYAQTPSSGVDCRDKLASSLVSLS